MFIFDPISPWSFVGAAATGLAIFAILIRGALDSFKKTKPWLILGGSKWTRIGVLSCSLLAALLLGLASLNPYWTDTPETSGFHLQVAVDVSESVLRANGGWQQVRKTAYEKIKAGIASTPASYRNECTAGIMTFRTDTNEAWKKHSLNELAEAFKDLDREMFASGEGTDIQIGLEESMALMKKAVGHGSVLLISDGNQTTGDSLEAAQILARQGIPIYVFPVTSRSPAIAITDADLPRQTYSKTRTFVRGLLLNRLKLDKKAALRLTRKAEINPGNDSSLVSSEKNVTLPSDKWVRFRWPVIFESFGLQYIDLTLTPEGSKEKHRRRFYSYVKRPPRILSLGGDNRWISAVPGDVAEIFPHDPGQPLTKEILKDVDAVVINDVPGRIIPIKSHIALNEFVENEGKGLLLINGSHYAAASETETVVMSYKKTPLQRILPVIGGPRPFRADPPSRQVAIIIDTSGSMNGWKLRKARQISKHIIQNLLRPKDRLDIITFTTGAGHIINDRLMDDTGKTTALALLDRIRASGGTDPNRALAMIGSRTMAECGIIFISDGEFGYIKYRPDCRVTVFEVGDNRYSRSSAIKKLADPIPVNESFDPNAITIPYFEPQERKKFFEEEPFEPLSMQQHLPKNLQLPVPELELKGSAVSYLKEGGVLNGVRPKLIDPVLAFGRTGTGYVGVFTSALEGPWLTKKEGREAIKAWLSRLIPFMERDRYDFHLEDYGDSIEIRISLVVKDGKLPDVTTMSAVIQFNTGEFTGIALRPDQSAPGTFQGEIRVERRNQPRQARISLRETGPDATTRPQLIPIVIPPKGNINPSPSAEAFSYGQNRTLLRQLAEITGGVFNPEPGTPFFKQKPPADRGNPLWPILATIAAFLYLLAIALKRWNP